MRILIIGGTRFIGPLVVKRLAAAGHEVAIFSRREAELPDGVRYLPGDRRRLGERAGETRSFAPDVVVDMVAMNEADARGLVETFRGFAERAVAISSMDVYRAYDVVRGVETGPPEPTPLDETSPLRQRLYPYEREGAEEYEKILVEQEISNASDLPGTVLRLPAVYGPGDYQHRLHQYLRRMDDGRKEITLEKGLAGWRWTRGYVEDVAGAIALAATDDRAADRVYNVGETEPLTEKDWVYEIGRAAGWSGEVVELDSSEMELPESLRHDLNTAQDLSVSTDRIRRELGYREEVMREEALRRTVAWERDNPPEEASPVDYADEDAALERRR